VVSIAHGGEPAHLNRLITRLKHHMPAVPVLAGLWLADERRPIAILDADRRANSLREAVEAVLEMAEGDPDPVRHPRPGDAPALSIPVAAGQGA
jgi:hypothetical protein